jgi:hypothetical protein
MIVVRADTGPAEAWRRRFFIVSLGGTGRQIMRKFVLKRPMRFFFLVSGSILWAGIWLTGFGAVHWLLYLPATFFLFAAATGICPGLIFAHMLFGEKRGEADASMP